MANFRILGKVSLSEPVLNDGNETEQVNENRNERFDATAFETSAATASETSKIIEWIAKNAKIDNVFEEELIQESKNYDRIVGYLTQNRLLTAFNTRTARQYLYVTIDDLPLVRFQSLVYWLKKSSTTTVVDFITLERFRNEIIYGFLNDQVEKCILKLVDDVYLPVLKTVTADFPLIVKHTLFHDIQTFLMKLTDLHYKLSGLNVLYVPHFVNFDGHVNSYEELVAFWCEQIRNCLNDTEQKKNDSLALATLKDEVDFWNYRYENLSSLKHQINSNKNVRSIIDYLTTNESILSEKFNSLVDQLDTERDTTIENIIDLQIFDEIDRQFWQTHDFVRIRQLIRQFLYRFRIFWLRSRYFADKSRMTGIFRLFAQQLLTKCSQLFLPGFDLFIDQISVLNRKICMLENSIVILDEFFVMYTKMENLFKNDRRCPWILEKSQIFDPLISITKRLKYLIGVCQAQIDIRYDWRVAVTDCDSNNTEIAEFLVPGSNYRRFETEYFECVRDFERSLIDIQSVSDNLLDLPTEQWFELTRTLDREIREIEKRIESIFDRLLSEQPELNVTNYIDLLISFVHFQRRPYLQTKFAEKSMDMLKMFQSDIRCAKRFLFELSASAGDSFGGEETDEFGVPGAKPTMVIERDSRGLLPPNSGSVLMHRLTRQRLLHIQKELMFSPIEWTDAQKHDIHESLTSFELSIESKTHDQYRKWFRSLGDCSRYTFNVPVVKFDRDSKRIECHLDAAIEKIATEAAQWTRLNVSIPYYLDAMFRKFMDSVRVKYEVLSLLESQWDSIRMELSTGNDPNQQLFFENLFVRFANRFESQSLGIYWLSDKSDWFTNQIQLVFEEISELVQDYRMCVTERDKNPDLRPEFDKLLKIIEKSVEK